MVIYPVSINTNNNLHFRSGCVNRPSEVIKGDDHILHYTYVMRGDFMKFAEHVMEVTKEINAPVNIYVAGCSDGSEAMRIMMEVYDTFMKHSFNGPLPTIWAFDKDKELVNLARSGWVNMADEELRLINERFIPGMFTDKKDIVKIYGDNLNKLVLQANLHVSGAYKFNEELLKHINFYVGDIKKEFKKIPKTAPAFVVCRHTMQYNTDRYMRQCARILYRRLKPGSCVTVSESDVKYQNAFVKMMSRLFNVLNEGTRMNKKDCNVTFIKPNKPKFSLKNLLKLLRV